MDSWPTSLPCPYPDGASYTPVDNIIRSQMDAGVPKVRRRFTAELCDVTLVLPCTQAQVQTLEDFVDITLQVVSPFQWIDWRKPDDAANVAIYRFKSRPSYSPTPGSIDMWDATIELELLTTFQGTHLLDVAPLTT